MNNEEKLLGHMYFIGLLVGAVSANKKLDIFKPELYICIYIKSDISPMYVYCDQCILLLKKMHSLHSFHMRTCLNMLMKNSVNWLLKSRSKSNYNRFVLICTYQASQCVKTVQLEL